MFTVTVTVQAPDWLSHITTASGAANYRRLAVSRLSSVVNRQSPANQWAHSGLIRIEEVEWWRSLTILCRNQVMRSNISTQFGNFWFDGATTEAFVYYSRNIYIIIIIIVVSSGCFMRRKAAQAAAAAVGPSWCRSLFQGEEEVRRCCKLQIKS